MTTCNPPGLGRHVDTHLDMTLSVADLRAPSVPTRRYRDAQTFHSSKTKGIPDAIYTYSRPAAYPTAYWAPPRTGKARRLEAAQHTRIELHQSTLLNLALADPANTQASGTESDLWILPDFEDWELDSPSAPAVENGAVFTAPSPPQIEDRKDAHPRSLLERAVNSNRERLRRRLEGDGWDFVGGRYSDEAVDELGNSGEDESSVDEEFDVVVLLPHCAAAAAAAA